MPSALVPPHDVAAEEALLGAMLHRRSVIELSIGRLYPVDFYAPRNGQVFEAITALHSEGAPVDVVTMANMLDLAGVLDTCGGPARIIELQTNTPSIESAPRYLSIIKTHAAARRELHAYSEAMKALYELKDPYIVAEGVSADLSKLDRVGVAPKRFWTDIDEYLNIPDEELSHWVIPGMCYSDSRVIYLATEKAGKSVWIRQCAYCTSQGIHPGRGSDIIPRRVMLLDIENPDREMVRTGRHLRKMCEHQKPWKPEMLSLFSRPFGFDLRNSGDRNELENAMDIFQPEIVMGGPIYKMMPAKDNESDTRHADAFQQIMGKMMERHKFALMIEHHAPMGGKNGREIRSIGGQRWPAWADVTIALEAKDGDLIVRKPHPTRGVFDFPKILRRGGNSLTWPWIATYGDREEAPPMQEPPTEDAEF